MHDNETGECVNYMWHKALAGRGASEVASCLYVHLQNMLPNVIEVTLYSDTCGEQNKNSHVLAMFIKFAYEHPEVTVNHKFLIPDHTHMECDVDHSMIERQNKKTSFPIYHPHDWFQLVRSTNSKKKHFKVHEMQQAEFLDFASLLKTVLANRKTNTVGDHIMFQSVQWLQYKENGIAHYKHSLNDAEDFKTISFLQKGKNVNISRLTVK